MPDLFGVARRGRQDPVTNSPMRPVQQHDDAKFVMLQISDQLKEEEIQAHTPRELGGSSSATAQTWSPPLWTWAKLACVWTR